MFSKPTKQALTRPEGVDMSSPRRTLAASLIAENVALNGDVATDGDVQLDGALLGDIRVGHLTIGESGQVEGAIEAETAEIRGRVAGSILARAVKLYATARVEGDITHDQLTIETGAHFAGRSVKRAAPVQEQLSLVVAAE